MTRYAIVDQHGEILKLITGAADTISMNTPESCRAVPFDLLGEFYLLDGGWVLKPDRPSAFHEWEPVLKAWVDNRSLLDHKDAKWEVIKLDRASHETGTFQWNGHTIDADMARLNGAATSVMIAQAAGYTYSNVWTLADNTMIPVTGQDIFAMGLALDAHVSACHARGRALRQLIYSCSTKEEVDAITWETAV